MWLTMNSLIIPSYILNQIPTPTTGKLSLKKNCFGFGFNFIGNKLLPPTTRDWALPNQENIFVLNLGLKRREYEWA